MNSIRNHIILFCFLLLTYTSTAQQNLTGTWEGVMGRQIFQSNSGQFLQIKIVQQGDKICGYTYDSVIAHQGDHCKAMFDGAYDKRKGFWVITGVSFIENSGTHVFMRIRLWDEPRIARDKMNAEVGLKSWDDNWDYQPGLFSSFFRLFGFDNGVSVQNVPESIELRRVSPGIPEMPTGFMPCFPHLQKSKDSVKIAEVPGKQVILKPADTLAVIVPKKKIVKEVVYTPPVVKKNDTVAIVQKMTERRKSVFSHLPVDVKNITLNLYDNAIVDGDTVTVFYNGRLLVDKRLLSEKPIVINLELDDNAKTHEIVLYAENLGSIPPNTALVVVNAGDKRYELHASASLEENAVLVFDYAPKKN